MDDNKKNDDLQSLLNDIENKISEEDQVRLLTICSNIERDSFQRAKSANAAHQKMIKGVKEEINIFKEKVSHHIKMTYYLFLFLCIVWLSSIIINIFFQ